MAQPNRKPRIAGPGRSVSAKPKAAAKPSPRPASSAAARAQPKRATVAKAGSARMETEPATAMPGTATVSTLKADQGGVRSIRPHVRVMTTGVFDLLHPGHLHMLEEAKKLGDELVVVLARDESATKEKHRPITGEEHRRRMVEALKPVDRAVLGHRGDYYRIVEELRPDIVALGFDQKYDAAAVAAECKKRGVACKVVRLPHFEGDLDGTRKIIDKVAARAAEQSLYRRT